jgi:hypothetical protein
VLPQKHYAKRFKSFSGSLFFIKSENSVGKAIMEPMKVHGLYKDDKERRAKLKFLKVGLGLHLIDIHMNSGRTAATYRDCKNDSFKAQINCL